MKWRGSCEDCNHWNWELWLCGLYSCNCAISIYDEGKPTNFLSWDDIVCSQRIAPEYKEVS